MAGVRASGPVSCAAVERVSYAEDAVDPDGGPSLVAAVERVRSRLRAGSSRWRRAVAILLPRSLVVRPGAVEAEREPVDS